MSTERTGLISGNFTLFSISLISENIEDVVNELQQKLNQAPQFFSYAPVVVNIATDALPNFSALKNAITELGMVLAGISGVRNSEQRNHAKAAGLAILSAHHQQPTTNERSVAQTETAPQATAPTSHALTHTVYGQIRSGQQVYAKNANLVVRGSVGAGAEVIADGSIHIYGNLRGRALAGANGDNSAAVFCQNLQAELVAVTGCYLTSEQLDGPHWGNAVAITRDDNRLKIEDL